MEPRKQEQELEQTQQPRPDEKKRRFRLVKLEEQHFRMDKLEERIAPSLIGTSIHNSSPTNFTLCCNPTVVHCHR
jgi:hypothetical protein